MQSRPVNTAADIDERRRKARRSAVVLGVIALMFYLGFIAVGVLRA